MPSSPIRAVVFDMGGTLEDIYYDNAVHQEATRGLRERLADQGLDPGLDLTDLQATVLLGMKAYQEWREQSQIELPAARVWAEFVFADGSAAQGRSCEWDRRLAAAAEDLTFFYETHFQIRSLRPEAPALLRSLQKLGLGLAIISNIISHRTVETSLEAYGIDQYFAAVLTSARYGHRKPDERIFLEAARLMVLSPAACAYVGDTISRDVLGARRAGYGLVIQMKSFLTAKADRGRDGASPDAVIENLIQVVGLVTPHIETSYDH
jgi:putative hydrolase of the HAD superfamily